MLTDTILFYIFAVMALVGGILTITRRNAIHSAISLIVSLLGVAGLYLLQQAEFLFAVQIVLYVGGIMVLFLFVIMLVNLDLAAKQRQFNRQWLVALAAVAGVAATSCTAAAPRSTSPMCPCSGYPPAWATRRWSPTRCSANICCRSRLHPSCCWWR
jgi:NADH:ubiquinone oxidoreductase subunit 6 (subunit J)